MLLVLQNPCRFMKRVFGFPLTVIHCGLVTFFSITIIIIIPE